MFYIRFDSPSHLHASLRRTPGLLEGTSHIVMDGHIYSINQNRREVLPLSTTDIQATGFQNRQHVPLFVPGEALQAEIIHQIVFEPTQPPSPQPQPNHSHALTPQDNQPSPEQEHTQQEQSESQPDPEQLTLHELQTLTQQQAIPMVETLDQRYSNIAIPKTSAVAVALNGHRIPGLIHASHITHPSPSANLIASQYPRSRKRVHYYFWRMALQQNTHLFIDLTKPQEHPHTGHTYYPQRIGEHRLFYELHVTRLRNSASGLYQYQVFNQSTGGRAIISRAHYKHWTNNGTIPIDDLMQLVTMINDHPRAVIHCLAGIGRTGTLLAATILLSEYWRGRLNRNNSQQVLTETLLRLHRERGPLAVHTEAQLALLQDFIQSLIAPQS